MNRPSGSRRIRSRSAAAAVAVALAAILSGSTAAQEEPVAEPEPVVRHGGLVSVFSSIEVPADEIREGEVVCIFCDATIEGDVTREIVVVMGSLRLNGAADREVVSILSDLELGPEARLSRGLVNVGGDFKDEGATIRGEFVNIPIVRFVPGLKGPFGVLGSLILWGRFLSVVFVFVILLVLIALVPDRIRTISEGAAVSLGLAYLAGIGAYVALFLIEAVLVISVVGIPVLFLLVPVFKVFKILGLAGLFHAIGARLGRSVGRDLSVLSAVLLGFLPFAVILVLPHFFGVAGFLVGISVRCGLWVLLEIPAVGMLFLTAAGGRPRARAPVAPAPPPAAAPPPPPAAPEP